MTVQAARGPAPPGAAGAALLGLVGGFIAELRRAGLPVSLTEHLDAAEAVRHVPLEDRAALKCALAATLVKHHAHRQAFETAFEVYFSLRGPQFVPSDGAWADADLAGARDPRLEGPGGEPLGDEDLARMLFAALLGGDQERLRAGARRAVQRYAGMEPGRPVGGAYYLYRTLRNLGLEALLERLLETVQDEAGRPLTPLEERLARDEMEARIAQLRKEVEAEIRRRLVADRGTEAMARTLRKPLPTDVEFMHATREDMEALRKAIGPLTRKLAARLASRRHHRSRGVLDFRRTIRRSLSYGGVPAEPQFRYKRPAKPEIMVIADISGSVAAFARFTLHLVYAISSHFAKVRSFVFIDGLDEVTDLFEASEDIAEAVHRVNTSADVVWVDGHSDYGHALGVFWDRYGPSITAKTTIMILGDARNNYHASETWVMAELQRKARRIFWLNPEPRSYWDTGDSIMSTYSAHCDGTFEVRTLRHLERFVEQTF
ncbi:MAG: VWA domain-containing protein [bacterium]|nr:VWA domain-containing protein [bacterium]MDE0668079.1 VWA domain-containing protein [bacterium]